MDAKAILMRENCISGEDVGVDEELVVAHAKRSSLPVIGRIVSERSVRGDVTRYTLAAAYRLPDGDVLISHSAGAFTRITKSKDRFRDYLARKAIWGYRYEPRLLERLIAIERAGRCHGEIYSWFGGDYKLEELAATRCQKSHAQTGKAWTAEEKIERLREHLERIAEKEWDGQLAAMAALNLLRDDSIQVIPKLD